MIRSEIAHNATFRGRASHKGVRMPRIDVRSAASAMELIHASLHDGSTPAPESSEFVRIPDSLKEIPAPPEDVLAVLEVPAGMSIRDAGSALEAQLDDALRATGMLRVQTFCRKC